MTRSTYLVAALVLTAVPSAAQVSTSGPPPKSDSAAETSKRDSVAQASKADSVKAAQTGSPAQPRHTLSQFVRFSDGAPVEGATVVLSPVDGGPGTRVRGAITDSTGRFTIDSLPSGRYELRVVHQGMPASAAKMVAVDGRSIGDFIIPPAEPRPGVIIGVLVFYALTIMLVRWHRIARSLDEMLKGQLSALTARLNLEVDPATRQPVVNTLRDTIAGIQKNFRSRPEKVRDRLKFFVPEFLFWSRGRENAAWVAIHEVERQMAAYLTPPERVVSYLQMAHVQLRALNNTSAIALADAIRPWLPAKPDEPTTPTQDQQRRALLGRAIAFAYEERDRQFSGLMEWHNKASWLILIALFIILFTALAAGNAVIFLAGAAGGFLSRLTRALRRDDLPLDYGASWTTLFLSPLFGALIAWFGLALITLATRPDVNLLGDAFRLVNWNTPTAPTTLAIAFLLGFSERFFDAVLGAIERRAAGTMAADEAAKMASAAVSTIQPGPPSTNGAVKPAAGGPGSPVRPRIQLVDEPLPVGVVSGKVRLDKPATAATGVNLSTDRLDFVPNPAALTIPPGENEGEFEIVPQGDAPGGRVQVKARVGNEEVNKTIEFV